VRGCSGTCDAASVQKSLQDSLFCDSHICFLSDSPNENLSDTSSLLPRRWSGSSTPGRGVLRRGSGRMIYGNAGKAVVASYPTQGPKRRASRPGLKPMGRQARCIRYHRAESYLIWDVLGHPDLTLKGKITFGVSAAQENKIDIDRTRPA